MKPVGYEVEWRIRVRMKKIKKRPVIIYVICSDMEVAEQSLAALREDPKKDILGAEMQSRRVTPWATVKRLRIPRKKRN